MLRYSIVAVLVLLLASCSGQAGQPGLSGSPNSMPDLASLGQTRHATVTDPDLYTFSAADKVASQNAVMVGSELAFQHGVAPTNWAVLGANFTDRTADKVTITGTCDGLFIMSSNFTTGRWQYVQENLSAPGTFDLPTGCMRADGSTFLAFVASGKLSDLVVTVHLTGGTPPPPPVEDKWNIMVWVAADNNLAADGVDDLNEMEAIGSTENVRVFAGFDIDPAQVSGVNGIDQVHFIKVVQDSDLFSINVTGDPANQSFPRAGYNSASPAHVREFVDWVNTNFPAQHTALILWNHGDGWVIGNRTPSSLTQPSKADEQLRMQTRHQEILRALSPRAEHANRAVSGVLADDTEGGWDLTNNATLAAALAGLHFDLLGFDACNMGQVEALYDYRGLADVLAGSEVLVPGAGYPYTTLLSSFNAVATKDAGALGTSVVDQYFANYDQQEYVTLGCFSGAQLDTLAAALKDLATEVTAKAAGESDFVKQAISAAFEPEAGEGARDLGGFLAAYRALTTDTAIQAKIDAAQAALTGVTLDFKQYAQPGASGTAVFLPTSVYFDAQTQSAYGTTQFAIDTGWLAMLQATGVPGGGGGGGGGYDVHADWVAGDYVVLDWGDTLADVDLGTADPDGTYWMPYDGPESPTMYFSADSMDSGLASEWAQLKTGASVGDYYIDVSWFDYSGSAPPVLNVTVKLYDSSMALKQDLGTVPLVAIGDYAGYATLHLT